MKCYIKISSSIFIYFIFVFILLSSSDLFAESLSLRGYNGFSFDKNKFYYDGSSFYIMKNNKIYLKKKYNFKKIFSCNFFFKIKGFVINKDYLVIYGLNNVVVVERCKNKIVWEKKFEEKITVRPLIYIDAVYIALDYDRIYSVSLLNGELNWVYRIDVTNFYLHTNLKFVQNSSYLFYIYANKMHVVNKYTGVMKNRISLLPRHINTNSLKSPRFSHIVLINNVFYICYDNGILLSLNPFSRSFLWQQTYLNCKHFVVYKNYIYALRTNGLISIIDKLSGKVIRNYSQLAGENLKQIIFFKKKNRFILLSNDAIYILKYNKDLFLSLKLKVKSDNIIACSDISFFLFKNKNLRQYNFK